ncbi:helix-turn-helix domain-containing protein [Bhargavaea cecembensis]|uniref:helix-turn-helix domain-containing protein n=1 Tax=Bhargavaea cecembensis TaxID=394098 RepID=UPI00058F762D|nr:helix-turn-helix domain-containing protein [Bhargavaea cecembensis]
MESDKVGRLIADLRKEKGFTQKELADRMNLSDRTISKWERGQGMPDVSLLPELSALLGVNIEELLGGELAVNEFVGGNMKKSSYFVCPSCNNIVMSTGSATVSCCGRKLEALEPKKATDEEKLIVSEVDGEWFISSDHPMEKEHYISFVAFAEGGQVRILKQYPEWEMQARLPKRRHGMLLWYCTQHGLFYQYL